MESTMMGYYGQLTTPTFTTKTERYVFVTQERSLDGVLAAFFPLVGSFPVAGFLVRECASYHFTDSFRIFRTSTSTSAIWLWDASTPSTDCRLERTCPCCRTSTST